MRIHGRTVKLVVCLAVATCMSMPAAGTVATAAVPPVKLVLSGHFGHNVNETTGGDVCTITSGDVCQLGQASQQPGGFMFVESIAGTPSGNVYVVDRGNNRIQELTATGTFVSMFGWEVNETKDLQPSATQQEKNVCTAASGDKCVAGIEGTAAGQLKIPVSVTVDPITHDLYVLEVTVGNYRVDKYTANGEFVWMIGKDVNQTTEGNICTAQEVEAEGVQCKAGLESAIGSTEQSAFKSEQGYGDVIAVGGPEDLLYVGDENRIQEFEADGKWKQDISLTSISKERLSRVTAITIGQTGDIYLAYRVNFVSDNIRKFNSGGQQTAEYKFSPAEPNAAIEVDGIAIDSLGRLAVTKTEHVSSKYSYFGSLYDGGTGHLITEFTVPSIFGSYGIGFNGQDELYAVASNGNEILSYEPLPVAELSPSSGSCTPGAESETSDTFDCNLEGSVNPEEVKNTVVWFAWGRTASLGSETAMQSIADGNVPVNVHAAVKGLAPNETIYDQLVGLDQNVQLPERLTSEQISLTTPIVLPKVIGEASTSFVKATSAVMSEELNPEHADTEYEFQYGPCEDLEGCSTISSTATLKSAVYGKIGTTLEARGLQPDTEYHYRLVATNDAGTKAGSEAAFRTGPAPTVQANTGLTSSVGTTSAIVSGTVNPDGQPATYTFELGVYAGAATKYGIVFSGPVDAGTTAIPESLELTGLQPGLSYAYRIGIESGYGQASGQPATFTTQGLSSVLFSPPALPMLAVPPISFPKTAVTSKGKKHGKAKRKGGKRKRTSRKRKSRQKGKNARQVIWHGSTGSRGT